jgi:hypothetical protein
MDVDEEEEAEAGVEQMEAAEDDTSLNLSALKKTKAAKKAKRAKVVQLEEPDEAMAVAEEN